MRPSKNMSSSLSIRENIVLPGDTNDHDTLFGGILLKYIDETAAISARRHSASPCVTASIDGVHFHRPIHRGRIIRMTSFVCSVGRSSMEVFLSITTEDVESDKVELAAVSFSTFVALGDDGKPCEVPIVVPESELERRLQAGEKVRREARLKKRSETIDVIKSLDL
ncbi:acyl-CoA thioesterase [Mariniblastus sp.]|nr:acyl-CoA thioesterase [Mariniblastus sp.]